MLQYLISEYLTLSYDVKNYQTSIIIRYKHLYIKGLILPLV